MSNIGVKIYFIEGEKIYRVGLNTKKRFLHLAGKTIPYVTFIFMKGDSPEILEIRVDPAYINPEGYWSVSEFDRKRVAYVIGEFLSPNKNKKITKLRPRPFIDILTNKQKEIIIERFKKDFGPGSWETLPYNCKMDLWKKGRGNYF